jgi:maltose 6'-phosphate phosphatase
MTPIQLLYVKNIILRHADAAHQELVFVMMVQNLAYSKYVEVIWAGEDGLWHNLKADYIGPTGQNAEIWQARATFPLTTEDSLPGDIQFVLHYQVAGHNYWDPTDYQNYTINADSGVRMAPKFPLLNVDFQPLLYTGQQFYPITIAVRQDLQPEKVIIRWTTDHWKTFTDTPAFFRRKHWDRTVGSNARNPNRYGCAIWISQLHLGDAYQVEYALLCEAKGQQYWDNNFGQNYVARHARLRLMTLNLHCYQEDHQDEKFSQIAKAIQDLHIDVVCLQEVGEEWNDGHGDWNSNAARIIRDRIGESYSVYTDWCHLGFGHYREGVAILSRYPFILQESKYVSNAQDVYNIHARKVVMGQIYAPYLGVINIFSAHLSWWQNGFRDQFETLRQWAESKQTSNVSATFLCGDFNNAANTEGYTIMSQDYEDQYVKVHNHHYNRANDYRIDYIFMKKGGNLDVKATHLLFTKEDYGQVSDHQGYYSEFEPRA